MKAVVLRGPGDLAVGEMAAPQAGPGEVLLRVRRIGLCGTDVKIFSGAITVAYPRLLGHEIVGDVIQAGTGVMRPAVGERVIVDPNTSCGTCFHCAAGQQHLCPNGQLLGRDRDGAFADLVVVPASNAFPLPEGIDDDIAPAIQVLATVIHAHRRAAIFPGTSVAVFGLGVTGQLHVQLAKSRGAYPVIGVTRSRDKRELAERLGADVTIDVSEDTPQRIRDLTGGRGADLVIESAGSAAALMQSVAAARVGGTLLAFGISTETAPPIRLYELYFKELAWISSRATKGEDFPVAIGMVERGAVSLGPLVTHVLALDDAAAALAMAADPNGGAMKIVLANGA